jgi:cell division protein FtsL
MNMAAERNNIQLEAINPLQRPNQQPESPRVIRRRIKKKPKRSLYTLKMLMVVCGIGVFGLMFIQLYMDSQISLIHYDIQRVQIRINRETLRNEQLSAQISELSQYSRIIEIANARGLTFNEENIINIQR